jgi:protein gp37
MGDKSNIEWTDATWNPIVGCSIVSPGCTNCYAMKMAARIETMRQSHYTGTTKKVNGNAVWTGKVALAPEDILTAPLRWKRPRNIFVNSMGDLHHEKIIFAQLDRVVGVMAKTPWHTYQILTKRAAGMQAYWSDPELADRVGAAMPLPNIWLGVSCERQQEADARIPLLLQTPAAIRFISAEPLLGPIDLTRITAGERNGCDALTGFRWATSLQGPMPETLKTIPPYDLPDKLPGLDWVIVGGESGHAARPMHPEWARDIRDQCEDVGVPFFFKQWGEFRPVAPLSLNYERVGKKFAGRRLDGNEHNGFPRAVT